MDYFRVIEPEDNKIWRKYFTYHYGFLDDNNVEIDFFNDNKQQHPSLEGLKIQALNHQGEVVYHQSYFKKDKMPPYNYIRKLFLIREDILQEDLFAQLTGIKLVTVKVDGEFEYNYKLLSFTNLQDCIDWNKSTRTQFDFTSKLVFDKSKIPQNADGFFLTGWHQYGCYYSIVNEKLKNTLLQLEKASVFLHFDKVEISEL